MWSFISCFSLHSRLLSLTLDRAPELSVPQTVFLSFHKGGGKESPRFCNLCSLCYLLFCGTTLPTGFYVKLGYFQMFLDFLGGKLGTMRSPTLAFLWCSVQTPRKMCTSGGWWFHPRPSYFKAIDKLMLHIFRELH